MNIIRRVISRILLIILPSDFLSGVLFRLQLLVAGLRRQEILILATITKTGTHYVRFLIAYYIQMLSLKKLGKNFKIKHDDLIVDNYFPNSWHTAYTFIRKRKSPTKHLKLIGLYDIPRSHMKLRKFAWKKFKVLHTYRDLKDQAVVSWNTKYKCNNKLAKEYKNIENVTKLSIKDNNSQLDSFSDISSKNINHLRINFTEIFKSPADTLALILQWLGEEPDMEICRLAAQLAKKTPSIIIGGGEKWHREKNEDINYDILNSFINENIESGAIGIGKEIDFLNEINY